MIDDVLSAWRLGNSKVGRQDVNLDRHEVVIVAWMDMESVFV